MVRSSMQRPESSFHGSVLPVLTMVFLWPFFTPTSLGTSQKHVEVSHKTKRPASCFESSPLFPEGLPISPHHDTDVLSRQNDVDTIFEVFQGIIGYQFTDRLILISLKAVQAARSNLLSAEYRRFLYGDNELIIVRDTVLNLFLHANGTVTWLPEAILTA